VTCHDGSMEFWKMMWEPCWGWTPESIGGWFSGGPLVVFKMNRGLGPMGGYHFMCTKTDGLHILNPPLCYQSTSRGDRRGYHPLISL
jgi:hypothetical protein